MTTLLVCFAMAAALPAQQPPARTVEPMHEEAPGVYRERLYIGTGGGKEIRLDFRRPPPDPQRRYPAIVCVSPWGNTAGALRGMGIRELGNLVRAGITVATFDYPGQEDDPSPDAVKDKYGPERQLNVRDVIRHVLTRREVEPENVGVVSFSSGNILAAGALTRPAGDPAVKFWVDAEGPTTRHVLLLNIPGTMAAVPPFPDQEHQGEWMAREFLGATLSDEDYWKEREAFRLMKRVRCRFLRLQGEEDHVHHWYFGHAIHALNSAMAGDVPWVRGGDGPVNTWHSDGKTIGMLPGRIGAQGERVLAFIKEMVAMPPLGRLAEDGRKPPRPTPGFAGAAAPGRRQ
jgi:acetyl esterase/lipase